MWPVMLEFGSGVAVAFLVSLAGCRALMLAGPLDHPGDARKVQTRPIPTSGGLAIGLGFALGLLVLSFLSESWRGVLKGEGVSPLSPSAGCAFVFLMIGFFDDARPISAWIKLILFSAVSLAASYLIGVIDVLPFGAGLELRLPFAIGLFGTALWVFVLVNCVNFMDGANGLAMGSVAIGLLGLAAIATDLGSASGAAICLCCAGALAGFLVWNVPNGALFAGDSGALFAGSVGAFASLLVMRETGLTPFVPPLLFLPLLADALLTLAWRAGRGHWLLDGHSEHVYQIALRANWTHKRVAFAYWAATAVCVATAFAAARDPTQLSPVIVLAAMAGLAMAVSWAVRRHAVAMGIAEV